MRTCIKTSCRKWQPPRKQEARVADAIRKAVEKITKERR